MKLFENKILTPIVILIIIGLYLTNVLLHSDLWHFSYISLLGFSFILLLKIFGIAYAIKAILMKNKMELAYRKIVRATALSAFFSTGIPLTFTLINPVFPDSFPWLLILYILGALLVMKFLKDHTAMGSRQTFFTVFFAYFLFLMMVVPFMGIPI